MSITRAFRFGVVTADAPTGTAWLDKARRIESLGYDTLLMPDSIARGLAVFPMLAAAAAATSHLHVGTYVLAGDLRHPVYVAKETVALALLSGGRFELGLGAGLDGTARDNAMLGQPFYPRGTRVSRLTESVALIRRLLDGETVTTTDHHYPVTEANITAHHTQQGIDPPHVPLLIAGGAPRMLALAATHADTLALGIPFDTDEAGAARRITALHDASPHPDHPPVEINVSLMAVGDATPSYLTGRIDPEALAASGSVSVVTGSPREMADQLRDRRERLGISYLVVAEELVDAFTPVLRILSGQ